MPTSYHHLSSEERAVIVLAHIKALSHVTLETNALPSMEVAPWALRMATSLQSSLNNAIS